MALSFQVNLPYCQEILTCLLAVNKTNLPATQESDNWINLNQRSPEVSAGTCCRYQIQYVYICVCSECREELGEGEAGLYWVII